MGIIKQILKNIKKWGVIDWIINLRYLGYALILFHAYLKMDISIEDYIGYGAVILVMERVSINTIKKTK